MKKQEYQSEVFLIFSNIVIIEAFEIYTEKPVITEAGIDLLFLISPLEIKEVDS